MNGWVLLVGEWVDTIDFSSLEKGFCLSNSKGGLTEYVGQLISLIKRDRTPNNFVN